MIITRSTIAQAIRAIRNKTGYTLYLKWANYPGAWKFKANRKDYGAYCVSKAMETFGKQENEAWKVACAERITIAKLTAQLVAASSQSEAVIKTTTDRILSQEMRSGGTIVQVVKSACALIKMPFVRHSNENQYSTNLIFKVGAKSARFDYCGGGMMRQACGPVQMMRLVAAFVSNFKTEVQA
jgi:hypothetical protein